MEFVDYYELLGIDQTADAEEVREAVAAKRMQFVPLSRSQDSDQRNIADEHLRQFTQAQTILVDEAEREKYDSTYIENQIDAQQQQREAVAEQSNEGDLLKRARQFWLDGFIDDAISTIKEATQARTDNPRVWYLRANIDLTAENYKDADYSINQAIKLGPNEARFHSLRGEIADAEAVAMTGRFLFDDSYARLGPIADAQKRFIDAEAAYRHAAYLDPHNGYYLYRISKALQDQGKFEDSLSVIREASEKFPDERDIRDRHVRLLVTELCSILDSDRPGIPTEHFMEKTYPKQVWFLGPNVCWFSNTKQIEAGKKIVAEIDSLGSTDDLAFSENVKKIRESLEFAENRHVHSAGFRWYLIILIVWIILIAALRYGRTVGMIGILLVTAALGYLVYRISYRYGWQINKKDFDINTKSPDYKAGLQ